MTTKSATPEAPALTSGAAHTAAKSARPYAPVQATPAAFVRAIVRAYDKYGLSAEAALAHAQISPAQWQNPLSRVTARQMELLSAFAMRELDDEALGWFSRPMRWGSYAMLLRASLSSPTLGVAMQRWCRHHGLLTQDVALHWADSHCTLDVNEPLGEFEEFATVSILRNVHGIACWLADAPLPLARVDFPFAAPEYVDALQLMFPAAALHFNAPRASLQFHTPCQALPLRRSDQDMNEMLERALYIIIKPYRRDRRALARVRQMLRANLTQNPQSVDTAETLAQQLHISVRSLHRFLQDEGTSLQTIKNEVRREHASDLLRRTRYSVKQIAGMSGFENVKSFSRAFVRWTGQSPQAFRAAAWPEIKAPASNPPASVQP